MSRTSNGAGDASLCCHALCCQVPMFIVGRRGQAHTGDTCTFLYGYGGFSISITPTFNPFRTVFMKHFDGILCIVNLRYPSLRAPARNCGAGVCVCVCARVSERERERGMIQCC